MCVARKRAPCAFLAPADILVVRALAQTDHKDWMIMTLVFVLGADGGPAIHDDLECWCHKSSAVMG
jgi:hypothetical protein